jgi:hypothetical protein
MSRLDRKELAAEYLSMDYAEMNDYRYQPTRLRPAVWAFEDEYVTVTKGNEKPADSESYDWIPVTDLWPASKAAKLGATIWSAKVRRAAAIADTLDPRPAAPPTTEMT